MQARIRSMASILAGASAAIGTQLVQSWLWRVAPTWFGAHGDSVELLTLPVPSVSFAISGLVGGWVAARVAPARPELHALGAALVPTLLLLVWSVAGSAADWAPLLGRLALLFGGAGVGGGMYVLVSRRTIARAAG